MRIKLWQTGVFLLFPWIPLACSAGGDSSPDGFGGSSGTGGAAGSAGASGFGGSSVGGTDGSGTGGATGGGGGLGGGGGMGGGSGGVGATGGIAGNAGVGGAGGGGGGPPDIPTPTGTCPEFVNGDVTFNPAGGARRVVITMGPSAATMSGPLIFYWFATGSNPTEARRGLPINDVTAAGGIVVAPYDVAGAGTFPWLSQQPQHDALFDEVLGCAVQKTQIDTSRIHALGFSAGALMTTHLSHARSKYMASVATYSGGGTGPFQEASNKFAAMMMTGGPNDMVVVNFHTSSQQWQTELKARGSFAMFCNHGGGHSIPTRLVPGVWQFFKDHPYGRTPSPYVGNIPSGINPPCVE